MEIPEGPVFSHHQYVNWTISLIFLEEDPIMKNLNKTDVFDSNLMKNTIVYNF